MTRSSEDSQVYGPPKWRKCRALDPSHKGLFANSFKKKKEYLHSYWILGSRHNQHELIKILKLPSLFFFGIKSYFSEGKFGKATRKLRNVH